MSQTKKVIPAKTKAVPVVGVLPSLKDLSPGDKILYVDRVSLTLKRGTWTTSDPFSLIEGVDMRYVVGIFPLDKKLQAKAYLKQRIKNLIKNKKTELREYSQQANNTVMTINSLKKKLNKLK